MECQVDVSKELPAEFDNLSSLLPPSPRVIAPRIHHRLRAEAGGRKEPADSGRPPDHPLLRPHAGRHKDARLVQARATYRLQTDAGAEGAGGTEGRYAQGVSAVLQRRTLGAAHKSVDNRPGEALPNA